MNIGKYIQAKKQQFQRTRINKAAIDSERDAQKLKLLREERLALEGRAKIRDITQQEESRIDAARGPSGLQRFGNNLSMITNRVGSRRGTGGPGKRLPGPNTGKVRGPNLGQVNRGSEGIDFGGRGGDYGSNGGSPFNKPGKKINIGMR